MASKYIYNEVFHNDELGVTKTIRAETAWEFDIKVKQLEQKWEQQLKIKRNKELIANNQQKAELMDIEQRKIIEEYNNILNYTLHVDDRIDWNTQYRKDKYVKKKFEKKKISIEKPNLLDIYVEYKVPERNSLSEIIYPSRKMIRENKELEAKQEYERRLKEYNEKISNEKDDIVYNIEKPDKSDVYEELNVPYERKIIEKIFSSEKTKREKLEKLAEAEYEKRLNEFNEERKLMEDKFNKDKHDFEEKENENNERYEKEKEKYNNEITEWKEKFENGQKDAVEKYIKIVLENSKYPSDFEKDYEIEYKPNEKILIVAYNLPNTEKITNIEGYKFVKTKNEIRPVEMKKSAYEYFYENTIFNITLRTIHEVFESTDEHVINMVVFNGFVTGIDPSNGKDFTNCIISLQVDRNEFENINLERIDSRECVRVLKGVFAGKLAQLAPVKPIMNLDREDRRFIETKEVLDNLEGENNLAEMPWEDFEHLVREVFAKEFSKEGAEVKVTQSSRDGGVDAIAFDPDPIRGGKFVIQAKRYNNVVPISAVRDLYGTMINEGATKGILVTTSYFGTDSQNFVKDKPLTLIDGQNLIYMMKKYGYDNVFIELKK